MDLGLIRTHTVSNLSQLLLAQEAQAGTLPALYAVSHSVYSCLTYKWAEYRVWVTHGARNSRFDSSLQQYKQYLWLADRQSGWDHVGQKVKLPLLIGHSAMVFF